MAAGTVGVVLTLAVAASVLTAGGPAPAQSGACPAEQWEIDAQRLADALADVPADDPGARLRERLADAGFVPGGEPERAEGGADEDGDEPADLLAALVEALADAVGPGSEVVVIGPDGQPAEITGARTTTRPDQAGCPEPGGR
ncbi:hypothetical protein BJF78_25925 [Pseudonocardia sp. CNS-139]|nr:hypothetical protein BJF78_25925 [Pseudonocardia sp. CNS-139]